VFNLGFRPQILTLTFVGIFLTLITTNRLKTLHLLSIPLLFLIWKLPNAKLFIDGRMPAWVDPKENKSSYLVWLDIYQTKPEWANKLDILSTDYLLISPNTFIDIELKKNSHKYKYKEVYRDKISVIYANSKD